MIIAFDSIKSLAPFSRSRIKIELTPPTPKDVEAFAIRGISSPFNESVDK